MASSACFLHSANSINPLELKVPGGARVSAYQAVLWSSPAM